MVWTKLRLLFSKQRHFKTFMPRIRHTTYSSYKTWHVESLSIINGLMDLFIYITRHRGSRTQPQMSVHHITRRQVRIHVNNAWANLSSTMRHM